MRGDICLYQGEELALPQADVPFERLQDPFGISFWPKFKGRDGCRTPMPWTDAAHGGFSTSEPWLPVDSSHIALNVESQEIDHESMLHFARGMIALRKERVELNQGRIEFVDAPEGVLAFARIHEARRVTCLFNMDSMAKKITGCGAVEMVRGRHAVLDGGSVTLGVTGFCLLGN
jgi:alpha-glucosidase